MIDPLSPEVLECNANRYGRDRAILQLLPTGRIAVFNTHYHLQKILPASPELLAALDIDQTNPWKDKSVRETPKINIEGLDI